MTSWCLMSGREAMSPLGAAIDPGFWASIGGDDELSMPPSRTGDGGRQTQGIASEISRTQVILIRTN